MRSRHPFRRTLALGAATLAALAAGASAAPAPIGGTVLFDGGADGGQILSGGAAPPGWDGPPGTPGVTLLTDPALTSSSAGALGFFVDGKDADTSSDRAEVQGSTNEREGQVRAYRWSVYVPNDFPQYPVVQTWQVLGQWHSALDGSPPFGFYVNNWDAGSAQNIGLDYNLASNRKCTGSRKISQYGRRVWEMPVPRSSPDGGTWLEFKMNVKWSASDGTARQALWVNGVRQTFLGGSTELNLRNLDGGCYNYAKEGYYRGQTTGVATSVRFDNFLMTNETFPAKTAVATMSVSTTQPTAGGRVTLRDSGPTTERGRSWDLDGDGVFGDAAPGSSPGDREQTIDVARPGVRYVRLRATDASGAQVESYRRVVVRSASPTPGAPPAVAVTDSAGGRVTPGAMVTFTAHAAAADGTIVGYEWDLDGDGFDDGNQFSAHAEYTEPGTVTARVRVTTDRGARAIASHTVSVG